MVHKSPVCKELWGLQPRVPCRRAQSSGWHCPACSHGVQSLPGWLCRAGHSGHRRHLLHQWAVLSGRRSDSCLRSSAHWPGPGPWSTRVCPCSFCQARAFQGPPVACSLPRGAGSIRDLLPDSPVLPPRTAGSAGTMHTPQPLPLALSVATVVSERRLEILTPNPAPVSHAPALSLQTGH